jgi:Stage II sporulation protein E (SpoIIE)
MADRLEAFNQIARDFQHINTDAVLCRWSEIITNVVCPDVIQNCLPSGVNLKMMLVRDDDAEIHERGMSALFSEGDGSNYVSGTFDARDDEIYGEFYERYGWCTVLYTYLSIYHRAEPGNEEGRTPGLATSTPVLLYSKEPDAMDVDQFRQFWSTFLITTSAMLLRLGFTYYATRSRRLWSAIPGILMLVSTGRVYELNDQGLQWFKLKAAPRSPLPLDTLLPEDFCHWIDEHVQQGETTKPHCMSRIFSMEDPEGKLIFMEGTMHPYRPMEHIMMHDSMSTGYDGLSAKEVDRKLYLLLIRDITVQWEAEKLHQEIELARRMQRNLLPVDLPCSDVFDIAAACQPASQIGGDIYDIKLVEDGRLVLLLGDATGHGVDSALLGAIVMGSFRTAVVQNQEPRPVLSVMDQALRESSQPGFVTGVYCVFDSAGASFQYGLAGHYAPIIYRSLGKCFDSFEPESLPMGVGLPPSYHIGSAELHRGDVIAIFSDGLIETRNPENETFESVLYRIIVDSDGEDSSEILSRVLNGVRTFRGALQPEDDITAIIIRIR